MTTQILKVDKNSTDALKLASELLRSGQLVAIPTETVYGLAGIGTMPNAVKEISNDFWFEGEF
jgi:L-threonylcarbamoyladenylate synthase